MTLTAKEIIVGLFQYLSIRGNDLMIHNTKAFGSHEVDFVCITRSGYAHEIEIKTSLADFRADFKKTKKHRHVRRGKSVFSHFWYAAPKGVVPLEEIPEYAGFFELSRSLDHNGVRYDLIEVKKAPRLHSRKCPESLIRKALRSIMSRHFAGMSEEVRKEAFRNMGN